MSGKFTSIILQTMHNTILAKHSWMKVVLVYTVEMFLLRLGTDRIAAAFLTQLVEPFFTPNHAIEQSFPQVSLSLEFLKMFIKYSAADLPQIMLNSPVVADAISGKLVQYLKSMDKRLNMVLQLFLNYIASHKGCQTSQNVFVNILQVYFYDCFDVNPLNNAHDIRSNTPPRIDDDYEDSYSKASSINSERDNESIANSLAESGASSSMDERSYSNRHNRIV